MIKYVYILVAIISYYLFCNNENLYSLAYQTAYQVLSESLYCENDEIYINENKFVYTFLELYQLNAFNSKYVEIRSFKYSFKYSGLYCEPNKGNEVWIKIDIETLYKNESIGFKVGIGGF